MLTSIFAIVMLGVAWDVYRTQRNYRRRKEAEQAASMLWHKPPPLLPPTAPSPYKARQQNGSKPAVKEPAMGVHVAPPMVPPQHPQHQQNGRQIRFQGESRPPSSSRTVRPQVLRRVRRPVGMALLGRERSRSCAPGTGFPALSRGSTYV